MMIIEAVVESWNGASEIGNEIEREREMMTIVCKIVESCD
jgi:hypothetical protein